ncbi:MAG: ScnB-like protein [Pseudomonadota bacterium]
MSDAAKGVPGHRGYHDIGGLAEGPVAQTEHVLEPWEKRVDALRVLLGDNKRQILRADGLRHAIETMGEDLYLELTYYERWMAAIIKVLVERGLMNETEIRDRMSAIQARLDIPPARTRPWPRIESP